MLSADEAPREAKQQQQGHPVSAGYVDEEKGAIWVAGTDQEGERDEDYE
jgi:hypothetical protein